MHNGILSVGAILRVLLLSEWLSELLLLLLRRRRRVHGAHCGVELPQRVVPCAALLLASARLLCLLEGLARAAAPAAHRDRLDEHLVHVDHGLRAQNMHMHTR